MLVNLGEGIQYVNQILVLKVYHNHWYIHNVDFVTEVFIIRERGLEEPS